MQRQRKPSGARLRANQERRAAGIPACDPLFALAVDFQPAAARAQGARPPPGWSPLNLRYPPWSGRSCRQTFCRTCPWLSDPALAQKGSLGQGDLFSGRRGGGEQTSSLGGYHTVPPTTAGFCPGGAGQQRAVRCRWRALQPPGTKAWTAARRRRQRACAAVSHATQEKKSPKAPAGGV
jgi:hypothetical protein